MTKLQAQRTEELNELREYAAAITPRVNVSIEARIGWLKNNLGTKLTKEERQMTSEYNASKASKTLSFNL